MTHRVTERLQLKLVEEFMNYADGHLSVNITWNDVMPVIAFCSTQQPFTSSMEYDVNWQKRMAYRLIEKALIEVNLHVVWARLINYIVVYNKQK